MEQSKFREKIRIWEHPPYHSARNKFERFRGVLELISRFEFDFRRCGFFSFERLEFLVCSKFNHRTCASVVACLCPHNSISNVVVSVTIHDATDVHVLKKTVAKTWNHCGRSCKSFVTLGLRWRKTNRTIRRLIRSVPQESWSCATLSGTANDWRDREHVVLDPFSNWKCVRSKGFFGEPLGSSDNLTRAKFW